jgi:hypothetical protein
VAGEFDRGARRGFGFALGAIVAVVIASASPSSSRSSSLGRFRPSARHSRVVTWLEAVGCPQPQSDRAVERDVARPGERPGDIHVDVRGAEVRISPALDRARHEAVLAGDPADAGLSHQRSRAARLATSFDSVCCLADNEVRFLPHE